MMTASRLRIFRVKTPKVDTHTRKEGFKRFLYRSCRLFLLLDWFLLLGIAADCTQLGVKVQLGGSGSLGIGSVRQSSLPPYPLMR